ncbi:hypothetical protein HDU91_000575 [Kappamyces sp. JEL0680]|nr:hypothetical protein HDU91_000575 [Kappamyces sp. JEL0680]
MEHCCYSFIDTSYSSGIASSSIWEAASGLYPSSIEHSRYVQLTAADPDSLFGYQDIFVQCRSADQPLSCYNQMKCHDDKIIVYGTLDCSDAGQVVLPMPSPQSNPILGTFTTAFLTLNESTTIPQWISYVPNGLLLSNTSHWGDVTNLMFLGLSMLLTFFLIFKYGVSYRNKQGGWIPLISLLACVSWIFYLISWTMLSTLWLTNMNDVAILDEITNLFFCLPTIMFVLQSTSILFSIRGTEWRWRVVGYLCLTIAHILICFPAYLVYFACVPNELHSLIVRWFAARDAWPIFMFSWNLLPNLYLIFLTTKTKLRKNEKDDSVANVVENLKKDSILTYLTIAHCLNYAFFILAWVAANYTTWPGSDRVVWSLYGWRAFSITLHYELLRQCTNRSLWYLSNRHLNTVTQGFFGDSLAKLTKAKANKKRSLADESPAHLTETIKLSKPY